MNRFIGPAFLCACLLYPASAWSSPVPGDNVAVVQMSPETHAAFEALRTAERFESAHVGFVGALSRYVAAFRVILAQPNAAPLFAALYTDATTEGKLYALSGFYFTDPERFAIEVGRLEGDRSEVSTLNGCTRSQRSIADIIRFPSSDRMRVPRGRTLAEALAAGSGPGDIAGGVTPLTFLETARPAPRDPL